MKHIDIPESHRGPAASYMICASPRTGSYLLCEGLANTGVAGAPTEHFSPAYHRHWDQQFGTPRYVDYLASVCRLRTSENGVFGAKVHARQLSYFLAQTTGRAHTPPQDQAAVIDAWFPGMQYIWLRREDRLGQGISYARSLQTDLWWDTDRPPLPDGRTRPDALRFDFTLVEDSIDNMQAEDDQWLRFFMANGIKPLELVYEQLVSDYETGVRQVLSYLNLQPPAGFELPAPTHRKMADGTTAAWRDRFLRLARAKVERTPEAFNDLHDGATVVVDNGCTDQTYAAVCRYPTIAVLPSLARRHTDYAVEAPRPGSANAVYAGTAAVIFTSA